jgi:PAS domain-containing protein
MCIFQRTGFAAILIGFLCLIMPGVVSAVETAPRITDREIIEGLVALQGRISQLEVKIDERFDAVNQRFESIDQRFESIDQQFDRLWGLMLVIIAGIFGLIGFIVWDRRTVLRPVEQRLDRLEAYLEHDLEVKHADGSRMTRLIKVLREMAREDEQLASVLRSFSLL